MTFKEVAHLYIGCMLFDTNPNFYGQKVVFDYMYLSADRDIFDRCKPILRLWSNATHEDTLHIAELAVGSMVSEDISGGGVVHDLPMSLYEPQMVAYLLSKHFDLFGLIASGQAIDATTLTPNPYKK